MHRTLLALTTLACCACSAGPSRPGLDDYRPTAVAIRAHFNGVPPETTLASLTLSFIDRSDSSIDLLYSGSATADFRDEGVRFDVTAGAASYPQLGALPQVRFFTVVGSAFTRNTGPAYLPDQTYWGQPGLLLVYALNATTWTPWRPTGQTVAIPQGYSWLRATCSPVPGQLQLEVRPIDELVELVPLQGPSPSYWGAELELIERGFVQSCGTAIPGEDLGSRISFDVASALAWAPDNSQLYYLSAASAQDLTKAVGLRRIRLSDSVDSELMVVPNGQGLQVDRSGTLFVGSDRQVLRISTTADAPPSITPIPIGAASPTGGVPDMNTSPISPDGRWIAFGPYYALSIWDVQQGISLDAPAGGFAGWSPSGELAYWSDQGMLGVLSATDWGSGGKLFPMSRPFSSRVAWTAAGPIVAVIPTNWKEWETWQRSGAFGLALVAPSTGIERTILDDSAGLITFVPAPSPLDTVFLWAKNCLGLFDTVCSSTLLRVTVTTGAVQIVAIALEPLPVAISPDGRRLALGTSKGIYVKDLPQ